MRYYMTRAEFTAFIASPERASAIHQGLEVYITDEAGAPIQKYVDSAWVLVRNFEGSMPDSAGTHLGVHKEVLTPVFIGAYSSGSQLLVDARGEDVLAAMGMSAKRILKRSYIGTRAIGAFISSLTNNASGDTYNLAIEVETHFDAIRFALPNHLTTGTITVGPFIASVGASISDPNNASGTWVAVTFSGAATVTLPNATAAADPTITWSDWVSLSSVVRTDITGAKPLVFLRGFIPAATTTASVFAPGVTITGWATRATRKWISRLHAGVNGVTTPANFTNTTNTNHCLFAAVQFSSRGRVVTVYGPGDSIMYGSGATIKGESFGQLACDTASTDAIPVQFCNGGWSGQTSTQYVTRAERMIPLIKPDIALYIPFTPNDGTPTASSILTMRQNLARFMRLCNDYNVLPVVLTGLPNPAAGWSAAADGLRTALNVELLAYPGVTVVDIGGLAGDGASPEGFATGVSTDNTHPDDSGNADLAVPIAAALTEIVGVG